MNTQPCDLLHRLYYGISMYIRVYTILLLHELNVFNVLTETNNGLEALDLPAGS